jgi:hypothetical protein
VLRLIKFQSWNTWSYNGANYTPMQAVNLGPVGTGLHTLALQFSGNQITVIYDGNQLISTSDIEAQKLSAGAIDAEMWRDGSSDLMSVEEVVVHQ